MAAPFTTTTEVPAPVNFIFQQRMLRHAMHKAINLVGSLPATIAEHAGSLSAKWQRIDDLTVQTTALAELTGNLALPVRDSEQASQTTVTATLAKYGNYILLNETVVISNPEAVNSGYDIVIGRNAGRSINAIHRNELEDNSTVIYSNGSSDGDVNTILASGKVQHAANVLDNNGAERFSPMSGGSVMIGSTPIRDSLLGLCHVDVEQDIRAMSDFKPAEDYMSHASLFNGEFGMLTTSGVRFLTSNEQSVTTDTGGTGGTDVRETTNSKADLYDTIIFGEAYHGSLGLGVEHVKEVYEAGDPLPAIIAISHPKGSSGAGDPLNEVATIGWKAWIASKILDATFGRRIRSAATDLSN